MAAEADIEATASAAAAAIVVSFMVVLLLSCARCLKPWSMGVKKKVGAQAGKAALERGDLARCVMMISIKAPSRSWG